MSSESVAPEEVHVGKDGWLFLVKGSNSVIDMYRNKSSFTDDLARQWVALLQERTERLNARGIQYVHIAAPEKLTVLHQFYNGELENVGGSPIRQIVDRYQAQTPSLLNLLPYFAQQIDHYPIYWKTDTHWSFWGCYSAYQMLCTRLGVPVNTDLPGYPYIEGQVALDLGAKMQPAVREKARYYQLEQRSVRTYANRVVRYKEQNNLVNEPSLHSGSHVVFRNDSDSVVDKRVVLFGDSFSEYRSQLLTGMLAETFREVHFIWNENIDDEYVRQVKPDIVVTELAERFMTRVPSDKLDIRRFADERIAAHQSRKSAGGPRPETEIQSTTICESDSYQLQAPKTIQEHCDNPNADKEIHTSRIELTTVRDARVYFTGDRCLIKTSCGKDVLRYGVDPNREAQIQDEDYRRLHGTSFMLGNSPGAHCYYHWMVDLLPKLGLLEKAGVALSSINHFLVREISSEFQIETLEKLGIDRSRIVETRSGNFVSCERLLHIPLDNGISLRMNRFVPQWLKHSFPAPYDNKPPIKLYISRPSGVRRGISNEDELRPLLEKAGFRIETMEGLSVREQAALLSRADVVMSPHGGALTNMVFCRPGTRVVELFSRHVYPFYYGLAEVCGLQYHAWMQNPKEDYARLTQYTEAKRLGASTIQSTTSSDSFSIPPADMVKLLASL